MPSVAGAGRLLMPLKRGLGGSGLILAPQGDGNDYLIRSNGGAYTTGPNGEVVFAFYVYPLNGGTDYTIAHFSSGIGA